jgi:uncharacterized phage infection (PIP) family protein YhgE
MGTKTEEFDSSFFTDPVAPVAKVSGTKKVSVTEQPVTERVKRESTASFTQEMKSIGTEVDLATLAKQTARHSKKKVKVVKESQLREMIAHILERFLVERQITVSEEEKLRLQKEAARDLNKSVKEVQNLQAELDEALVAKVDLENRLEAQQDVADLALQAVRDELARVTAELDEQQTAAGLEKAALEDELEQARDDLEGYAALEPEVASLRTMLHVVGEESIQDAELAAQCRSVEPVEEVMVLSPRALDDLRVALKAAQDGRRQAVQTSEESLRERDDLLECLQAAERAATDSANAVAFSQEQADSELSQLQERLAQSAQETSELRTENARQQGQLEALQQAKDELAAARAAQQAAEQAAQELRTEQANMQGERGALLPQIEQLTAERDELAERLASSQDFRRELREESQHAQDRAKSLESEQAASAAAAAAQQIAELQEQLAQQESHLDETTAQLEKTEAELAVASGKMLRTPTPGDWLHWDFSVDDSKNYAFVNDDGQIHLLRGADGEWGHSNLSQIVEGKSGEPVMPAQSGCNSVYAPAHCQHVIYTAEDGSVREMWSKEDDWHQENLSAKTGAPPAAGKPNASYVHGRNLIVYPDATGDL